MFPSLPSLFPGSERRRRVPRYHLSSTFHTHSRTRTHLLPDPPARDLTRLITCTASTQRRLDDPAYREANEKLFQSVHLRPLRTIILLLARASPRFVPRIESNDNENIFIHIFRTRKIKRGKGGRGWNGGNCPFVRLRREGREGRVYTFRTTSSFEQMVRIGTPINKPTPQSIVTPTSSFFPSLFPFRPIPSSIIPSRFLLARFHVRCSTTTSKESQ